MFVSFAGNLIAFLFKQIKIIKFKVNYENFKLIQSYLIDFMWKFHLLDENIETLRIYIKVPVNHQYNLC